MLEEFNLPSEIESYLLFDSSESLKEKLRA